MKKLARVYFILNCACADTYFHNLQYLEANELRLYGISLTFLKTSRPFFCIPLCDSFYLFVYIFYKSRVIRSLAGVTLPVFSVAKVWCSRPAFLCLQQSKNTLRKFRAVWRIPSFFNLRMFLKKLNFLTLVTKDNTLLLKVKYELRKKTLLYFYLLFVNIMAVVIFSWQKRHKVNVSVCKSFPFLHTNYLKLVTGLESTFIFFLIPKFTQYAIRCKL